MSRYIAFLRAINVGGRTVKMDTLRAMFESLDLHSVETFIASGNVVFESRATPAVLQKKIETHLLAELGYEVATFLRSDAQVARIAQYQPFSPALMDSAQVLNVGFLAEPLDAEAQEKLKNFATEIDAFHTHEREIYWLCKIKQSDSKFSNAAFERALKVRATFRGMNTVQRLAKKYAACAK